LSRTMYRVMDVQSTLSPNRRSYDVCLPHKSTTNTTQKNVISNEAFGPIIQTNRQFLNKSEKTTGYPPLALKNNLQLMFINLMFNFFSNQKPSPSQQISRNPNLQRNFAFPYFFACMTGFSSSSAFPPSLIASSTLSKGAVEFHPSESRPPDTASFPSLGSSNSSGIRSLVQMQDPYTCSSYIHLCFPSTRTASSSPSRTRHSSFFSSNGQPSIHPRLGPSTPYNFQFSSPRSFNSQSPIGTSHLVKKKKKKSNLNQKITLDQNKFVKLNIKNSTKKRNLNVSMKFNSSLNAVDVGTKRKILLRQKKNARLYHSF